LVMSEALETAKAAVADAQAAFDSGAVGANNEFESNSDGLRQAAFELQEARSQAEAITRPPPPSPSDLAGGQIKITPADNSPMSPRQAAAQLSELHRQQEQTIREWDDALAQVGAGWHDDLTLEQQSKLGLTAASAAPAAPEAPVQPSESDQQQKTSLAQERQRVEAERAQVEQERQAQAKIGQLSAQARNLIGIVEVAVGELAAKYPEVRTPEDLAAVRARNPQRAAAYELDLARINGGVLQVQALQHQHNEEVQKTFDSAAVAHDAAFCKAFPEFDDPKTAVKLNKRAFDSLKGVGLTEAEIKDLWTGRGSISLRDSRAQKIVGRLAILEERFAQAEQVMKPTPKQLAPVQRPGVAPSPTRGTDQEIAAARKRIARAGSQRAGALAGMDLLQAMRRGGRL
jgi:hypothetical protein